MGVFTQQKVTVQSNQLIYKEGTRNPLSGFQNIATNVPCRITGTHTEELRLFILKKYFDQIPDGIHKGYKIIIEDTRQEFSVKYEPYWAGGVFHHIEVILEEFA